MSCNSHTNRCNYFSTTNHTRLICTCASSLGMTGLYGAAASRPTDLTPPDTFWPMLMPRARRRPVLHGTTAALYARRTSHSRPPPPLTPLLTTPTPRWPPPLPDLTVLLGKPRKPPLYLQQYTKVNKVFSKWHSQNSYCNGSFAVVDV